MRVAILEDDAKFRRRLTAYLTGYFQEDAAQAATTRPAGPDVSGFGTREELLAAYAHGRFDLLVFDCLLGDGKASGVDVLRELRGKGEKAPAILVTTSPDFAVEGYGVGALSYLLKPVSYGQVKVELDRLGFAGRRVPRQTLTLPGGVELDPTEVDSVFSCGHYMGFHEARSGLQRRARVTFAKTEDLLAPWPQFFHCARGVLVNLDFVERLDGADFVLFDGRRIPVSRRLLPAARERIARHEFDRMRNA